MSYINKESYIIYKDGIRTNAINGNTGIIDYSGHNANAVIQNAIDSLTPGRKWKEKITLKGNFEIDDTIHIRPYTIFELCGSIKLKSELVAAKTLIDTPQGNDIDIVGGVYDGNSSAYNLNWANRSDSPWNSHGILLGNTIVRIAGVKNINVTNVNVKNTVRSNIVIEGDSTGVGDNVLISGCLLENSLTDHWIYPAAGKNITIQNCSMTGYAASEGVALGTSTNILKDSEIRDCKIYNVIANPNGYSQDIAIHARSYIDGTDETENMKITNNLIDMGSIYTRGIQSSSKNTDIIGNFIKGVTGSAGQSIRLTKSHCRIIGNRVINHGSATVAQEGISVLPAENVSNIQISGNKIYQSSIVYQSRGIILDANNYDIKDILINDNDIYVVEYAIRLKTETGKIIDNVSVIGNKIYANGSGKYWIYEQNNGMLTNVIYAHNLVKGAVSIVNGTFHKNIGYKTENSGTLIVSGTNAQTSFIIPHGLAIVPTNVQLETKSLDAAGSKYWIADINNITINFLIPPPTGINNVIICWNAGAQ